MAEIKKITVENTDGTIEVISKGLVANYSDGEDNTVTFNMVGIGGKDLYAIVMSMVSLGEQMGFFGDKEVSR
ncbi:hypothetical protein [Anaerovorax sp. IOR16]|uniref:hypothetical protein n=1 Tax=Anaerovorax sp. IOR16 TaxID=2773458 RepID=UPI0019D0F5D6|nr:hypothetical protein [Anaerovorax sp. IOR16]